MELSEKNLFINNENALKNTYKVGCRWRNPPVIIESERTEKQAWYEGNTEAV